MADLERPFSELDSMIEANEAHLKALRQPSGLRQQACDVFLCLNLGELGDISAGIYQLMPTYDKRSILPLRVSFL